MRLLLGLLFSAIAPIGFAQIDCPIENTSKERRKTTIPAKHLCGGRADTISQICVRGDEINYSGTAKDGNLWNGKWYCYDVNGILTHIEVYKNGCYVGNRHIED